MSQPSAGQPRDVIEVLKRKLAEDSSEPAFFVREEQGWSPRTRDEFCTSVRRLAARLRALGVGKGDRFALFARTRYEWEIADKAILSLGAVVVAIDAKSSPEDVEYMLENSKACGAIVEDAELYGRLPSRFVAAAKAVIAMEHVPFDGQPGTCLGWQHAFGEAIGRDEWGVELSADDPAVILYTSGTTGRPKGILFRHRDLVRGCAIMQDAFQGLLSDTHKSVAWLPLSNGTGRFIVLMGFYLGAHQYFVRDPGQIMASIKEINPTYMFGVPRFFEKVHDGLMAKLNEQPAWIRATVRSVLWAKRTVKAPPLRSVLDVLFVGKIRRVVFGDAMRFMFCGSAPTDPDVLRFFDALGIPVYECYGVSESAILLAMNRPGHTRFGTVGTLLQGNKMRIAADSELLVKGEAMFSGYIDTDNSDLFDADGYYHTGDLVRLDGEYLVLTGRKKEIIKTSTGMRISPVDVEQAYGRIVGIDQLVAVGNGRRFITALITLDMTAMRVWCANRGIAVRADSDLATMIEVRQYLESELHLRQERLAEYKQVKKFVVLPRSFSPESGELTPSMKLRRSVIEAQYRDEIDAMYQS